MISKDFKNIATKHIIAELHSVYHHYMTSTLDGQHSDSHSLHSEIWVS